MKLRPKITITDHFSELKDPTLLPRLIGYSNCINHEGFRNTIGRFLKGANLFRANLEGTNLRGANLESANLSGAQFRHNIGISESLKQDLMERGAIFRD